MSEHADRRVQAFEYVLPARRLTGTRDEVLEQIDELIGGLMGLRELISRRKPDRSEGAPKARFRLVRAVCAAWFLPGAAVPAQAQTGAPPDPRAESREQRPPFVTGPRGDDDLRTCENTALFGVTWVVGNKAGVWYQRSRRCC